MSISCMMHVWNNSSSSGNDRLVLLAIADEADDQGRNAFPSTAHLAEKVNTHPSTVLRSIVRLEKLGELEIIRPAEHAVNKTNKFKVIMSIEALKDETIRNLRADKPAPRISTDKKNYPQIKAKALADGHGCNNCQETGWVDSEDGLIRCPSCDGAAFIIEIEATA